MYQEAAKYGLNVDKSRWIASFLEDAGLVEKPRYGSLRATALGKALAAELPLAAAPRSNKTGSPQPLDQGSPVRASLNSPANELMILSQTPSAHSLGAGVAFENAIRDAFLALGFNARTISGSGDTDILVTWSDSSGVDSVAIVEAKSRSNAHISHTDISDVALETHKSRHQADFVAIVGPAFAGETLKNMAAKRKWALIDAPQLGQIVEDATDLGLGPKTTSLLFKVPNGIDELNEAIQRRRRDLSIVSFVMAQLANEAADSGEAITARDISRDARKSELRPTLDEVVSALTLVKHISPGAIRIIHNHEDIKFSTFVLGDARSAAAELRALASAVWKADF